MHTTPIGGTPSMPLDVNAQAPKQAEKCESSSPTSPKISKSASMPCLALRKEDSTALYTMPHVSRSLALRRSSLQERKKTSLDRSESEQKLELLESALAQAEKIQWILSHPENKGEINSIFLGIESMEVKIRKKLDMRKGMVRSSINTCSKAMVSKRQMVTCSAPVVEDLRIKTEARAQALQEYDNLGDYDPFLQPLTPIVHAKTDQNSASDTEDNNSKSDSASSSSSEESPRQKRKQLGKDQAELCNTLTKEQTAERKRKEKFQRAVAILNKTGKDAPSTSLTLAMTHLENAKHTESDTSSDVTTEPESRLNPGCSETDALLGAHWLDLFPTETPNISDRFELGKDEVELCTTLTKEQTIEREKRIKLQRAISRLNATSDTAPNSNDEEMIIAIPRYLFEYGSSTTTHRQGKRGLSFKKSFTISLAICSVLAMAIIIYAILFNLKIEQIQNRNDTNHP